MTHRLRVFIFGVLLAGSLAHAPAVHADRDIVYSARYYLPPHSKGLSHYHLYRINPNGAGRTQITFAPQDDESPQWSPDGKSILFLRDRASGKQNLCVLRVSDNSTRIISSGSNVSEPSWGPRTAALSYGLDRSTPTTQRYAMNILNTKTGALRQYPNATRISWATDGSRFLLMGADSLVGTVYNYPSGKKIGQVDIPSYPIWLSNNTLAFTDGTHVTCTNVITKVARTVKLVSTEKDTQADIDGGTISDVVRFGQPGFVLLASFGGRTLRTYSYYKVDLKTGAATHFTESEDLSWSPDGAWFCTTPYADVSDYDKKADGTMREVYTGNLEIGSGKDGSLHSIVTGMVHVRSCDWRGGFGAPH